MTDKKVLLGLTTAELKQVAQELGMPAFTGGQIAKWLYEKNVRSIDEMTNLSKQNRERLAEKYCVGAMEPIDCQRSVDGTIKYLFPVRCSSVCCCDTATSQTEVAARRDAYHYPAIPCQEPKTLES